MVCSRAPNSLTLSSSWIDSLSRESRVRRLSDPDGFPPDPLHEAIACAQASCLLVHEVSEHHGWRRDYGWRRRNVRVRWRWRCEPDQYWRDVHVRWRCRYDQGRRWHMVLAQWCWRCSREWRWRGMHVLRRLRRDHRDQCWRDALVQRRCRPRPLVLAPQSPMALARCTPPLILAQRTSVGAGATHGTVGTGMWTRPLAQAPRTRLALA